MDRVKRILAVSRSTAQCNRVVECGISLARSYSASLCVLSVVHDPFNLAGWNLPVPSFEEEYRAILESSRKELERIVSAAGASGLDVKRFVRDGKPVDEVLKVVAEEKIDLMILLAHDEGRIEHFLFGRTNEELFRRMPCSILLWKSPPAPDTF